MMVEGISFALALFGPLDVAETDAVCLLHQSLSCNILLAGCC